MRKSIVFTMALGFISLAAIFVSHLALTDISHGEADLAAEWRVLQISFVIFFVFHVAALAVFARLLRLFRIMEGHARTGKDPRRRF